MLKTSVDDVSEPARRPIGRPRSEKTRRAILKSAYHLLKQNGFDCVSMQQIALEAGVSTATLYRWWANKQAVLLEAYLETTREVLPYGKRGSPLARLRKYALRLAEFLRSDNGQVFIRLMVAMQDNAILRQGFYEKVYLPRRAEGRTVVEEAIKAGELPVTADPDFIISLLIGPMIQPALMGQQLSAESAQAIFDFVIKATLS